MITLSSTPISSAIYQMRVGGDLALLKGMIKAILKAGRCRRLRIGPARWTTTSSCAWSDHIGFEALVAHVQATH